MSMNIKSELAIVTALDKLVRQLERLPATEIKCGRDLGVAKDGEVLHCYIRVNNMESFELELRTQLREQTLKDEELMGPAYDVYCDLVQKAEIVETWLVQDLLHECLLPRMKAAADSQHEEVLTHKRDLEDLLFEIKMLERPGTSL